MTIRILPWNIKYIAAIDQVYFETRMSTYPNLEYGFTESDIQSSLGSKKQSIEKRRNRFTSRTQNEHFFMAKDGNAIVGSCIICGGEEVNELESIYVLPAYQGKGIGRMFWQEAVRFFNPHLPIILGVVTYNKKAIDFYQKLGFLPHEGRFQKGPHSLKNGRSFPILTMIYEKHE